MPGDKVPIATRLAPIQSTATTEAKMRKIAKAVRKARALIDERAAPKAASTDLS